MKKLIFFTVFCEKIGILSKEEAGLILKNNRIHLKDYQSKAEN